MSPSFDVSHALTFSVMRERQGALLKSPTLGGAFACMWRDGVHSLQCDADD